MVETMITNSSEDRYYIHENAHSYGLHVVRDPALAHRYVVWVQPTWDEASRFQTVKLWTETSAFRAAAMVLRSITPEARDES